MSDHADVVARVQKNTLEEVVVALTQFKGTNLVDVRTYADFDNSGEKRPTKKGIAIKLERLPELMAALKAAEDEAIRRGALHAVDREAPNA